MDKNTNATQKKSERSPVSRNKKILIAVISAVVLLLALCAVATAIFGRLQGGGDEEITFPPINPDLLEDTKEEGFDIMEYEEYLDLTRTVFLENKGNGTKISIDGRTYRNYGEGVALVYEMIEALIAGDVSAYNGMVSEDVGHFEWFSQQQIYDATIIEYSKKQLEGKNGNYTEFVIILEYKIHENNGSYRNNVESDSSRPQYIVINDSTGEFLVMDIIDTVG